MQRMQKGSSCRNARKGRREESRTSELELDPCSTREEVGGGIEAGRGRIRQNQSVQHIENAGKKFESNNARLTNNWRFLNAMNEWGRCLAMAIIRAAVSFISSVWLGKSQTYKFS